MGCLYVVMPVADGLLQVHWQALYQSYGLSTAEMMTLLAVGHGSSLFLGTFLGISSDSLGRKRASILYCILQALGCLAKLSSNYEVLSVGHVCLGLASSLYFSVFEAWMTTEHEKVGFKQELLSETFWMMAFASGIVGISSGAIANVLMEQQALSARAPSVVAGFVTFLCLLTIIFGWNENVGTLYGGLSKPLLNGIQALRDKRIALLGLTQAGFDLSIAVFWLLWTPTLVADGREVQTGLIYACLMGSMMLGSSIAASFLCGPYNVIPEIYVPYVLFVAGASLILPAYDYQDIPVLVTCFSVFHICVGIAWPSLARLRSIYIQNDRRATMLSLFRAPVSAILLLILIRGVSSTKFENSTVFSIAILGLMSGAACIRQIAQLRPASSYDNLNWRHRSDV
uniref:Major facilitator superfamily (MFS) profile domain-containing protein n=1 Tax=Physcomitrium patens TaxID=3218 RepID=A0A7I4C1F8_PHYPA